MTQSAVKVGFRDQGIVKVSVLDTDETNRACSAADVAGKPLDEARRIAQAPQPVQHLMPTCKATTPALRL